MGFYFSKFEAPLDYCSLISLLAILESWRLGFLDWLGGIASLEGMVRIERWVFDWMMVDWRIGPVIPHARCSERLADDRKRSCDGRCVATSSSNLLERGGGLGEGWCPDRS